MTLWYGSLFYYVREPRSVSIKICRVFPELTLPSDPQVHIKAVNELSQSGVSIVNVHFGELNQKHVIESYSKEVLPKVKAA